jgi:hypothetical protein
LVSDELNKHIPEKFSLEFRNLSETPIEESSSPSHNIIETTKLNERSFQLEAVNYRPQNDFVYNWKVKAKEGAVLRSQGGMNGEAGYFMARVCPELLDKAVEPEEADYLFLADASKSLGEREFLLQFRFVEAFMERLKSGDRFNIGTYNLALDYFDEKFRQ